MHEITVIIIVLLYFYTRRPFGKRYNHFIIILLLKRIKRQSKNHHDYALHIILCVCVCVIHVHPRRRALSESTGRDKKLKIAKYRMIRDITTNLFYMLHCQCNRWVLLQKNIANAFFRCTINLYFDSAYTQAQRERKEKKKK